MFLNYLQEDNKEYFLKVCVHAALANEIFADEQRETLDAYCREMNLESHIPDINESFLDLLKVVSENTTSAEKNIFVIETLALIKADGVYDEKEKTFMKKLIKELNVSEDKLEEFTVLLNKYIAIGEELFSAITE